MPANPGVNPSLTITALAERAMSQVPPKAGARLRHLPDAARGRQPLGAGRLSSVASTATQVS